MEWVAIAVTIARDPAVHRMAAALRVRVPEVVGLLALTFTEMAQHASDGQVGSVPDGLLETWASWHGKRGLFAAQFRAELCDDSGLVVAWEKYNGANIRRFKAASGRTRAWRERNKGKNGDGNRTHTDTHNSDITVCRTEQNSTEQDKTSSSSSSGDVARLLDGLPAGAQRTAWAAEIAVAAEGMHGPALSPAQVDVACRAYVGNGHLANPSLRHFRAFLADAGRPARPALSTIATVVADDAEGAWEKVLAMVPAWQRREITSDVHQALPDGVKRGISKIGGFKVLSETRAEQLTWLKKDFLAAYRRTPAHV